MNQKNFLVLRYICEARGSVTQRLISEATGISLGSVNAIVNGLLEKGFVDENYQITEMGAKAMEPYRVKNAVILAAGMSTRFVPVSYELPKGLISVKGDILVERLIEQLQDAGVREIVMVVGYMMEKYFYLRDKYNVKLVVNNEFATKNTHSSIYAARDYLSNTYICCSDNYYPRNMFHQYEYRAFYCSIFLPGTSYVERAFTFDADGLVIDTNKPSHDQWIMYGHAYYDQYFTDKFKPILKSYYGRPGIEYMYWETIYAENVAKLPMYVQKCKDTDILEFDSMEELKAFDPDFITHNHVKVFENICKTLQCKPSEIKDIEVIKKGLNNRSFKFNCNGKYYVYRHPGVNASDVIDRTKESYSLHRAKELGIDETLIHVDETEGWKISWFIETTEEFDFSRIDHIQMLADHLKKLHSANIQAGFRFDYPAQAKMLIELQRRVDGISYRRLMAEAETMEPILRLIEEDGWQVSLCHNDIYEPNLLMEGDRLHLIDWEFAGDSDIGYDICKLFAVHNPSYEEIDNYLYTYYGRETTQQEKLHLLACAAVIYYYWFVWGVYASKNGEEVSGYMMVWYDKMCHFRKEVLKRIGNAQ